MNRFLFPNISRKLLKGYVPLSVFYFLSFLLFLPNKAEETHLHMISYDVAGVFWAFILSLFLGGHYFWVLFASGSKAMEELKYLSTLPVSKKRIARNDIKLFFYVHSCFISLILVIGLLLLLLGLLTGIQLLCITVVSLWLTICTMLSHLICCALKNKFIHLIIFLISCILVFIPLVVFQAKTVDAVTVTKVLFVGSLILTGISLLVQRHNENKFMDQDLL